MDADDRPFMAAETEFMVMGGETCNLNPPRSECATALTELAEYHYSYLNIDYHPGVLASWQSGGCMDEIKRRLGYRLELQQGTYADSAQTGDQFNVTLDLKNVGWAAPYNPRLVQILLRHSVSGEIYGVTLPDDPRFWFADAVSLYTLNADICTPANMPVGSYDLLLNLPDAASTLRSRPDYAASVANVGVADGATGFNDLGHQIAVSTSVTAVACTSSLILTPYNASAVMLPLVISQNGSDAELTWSTNAANCTHTVYRSSTPYVVPTPLSLLDDTLLPGTVSYSVVGDIGETAVNHFYHVRAENCDGMETAVFNEVAEFDFPLISGN